MNVDGTYSYAAGNSGKKPVDFKKMGKPLLIAAVALVLIIGILFVADDKYGKDVEE